MTGRRTGALGLLAWLPALVLVIAAVGPALVGLRVFAAGDLIGQAAPWAETSAVTTVTNACVQDTVDSALPSQLSFRERVADGDLTPDFESQPSAGTILGASPSVGTSSPLFLATLPFGDGVFTAWLKLAEIAVVVAGAVLWARRIGLSGAAGALGGFLFATGGFMVMWTNWPQTRTAAVFPLLFWALERIIQDRTLRSALPFPLVLAALVLGGFPVVAIHAVYVAAVYAVVRLVVVNRAGASGATTGGAGAAGGAAASAPGDAGAAARAAAPAGESAARRWLVPPALAVGGGLLALALVAVQLAPWLRQLASQDLGYRADQWAVTFPAEWALTTVYAQGVGNCALPGGWWAGFANPIEGVSFVGAGALVLALAALVMPRRVAAGVRPVLAAVALLGLAVTFLGGPINELLHHLPAMGTSGMHRMRGIGGLAFAMLAAIGFDALLRAGGGVSAARRAVGAVVAVAAVAGLALAALAVRDLAPDPEAWGWVSGSVLLSAAAGALVALVWLAVLVAPRPKREAGAEPGDASDAVPAAAPAPSRAPRVTAVLVAALVPLAVGAEGVSFARSAWPLAPAGSLYPATATDAWLRDHAGQDRIAGVGSAYLGSAAQLAGLRSLSGHGFVPPEWADLVTAADELAMESPTNLRLVGFGGLASPVMDRLAVRYAVADTTYVPPGDLLGLDGLDETAAVDLGSAASPAAGAAAEPAEAVAPVPAGLDARAVRGVLLDLRTEPTAADVADGLVCAGDAAGAGPGADPVLRAELRAADGAVLATGERRLRAGEGGVVSVALAPVAEADALRAAAVAVRVEGCAALPVGAALPAAPADDAPPVVEAGDAPAGPAAWAGLVVGAGDGLAAVDPALTPDAVVYANPDALPRIRWASAGAACGTAARCAVAMDGLPADTVLLAPGDLAATAFAGAGATLEVVEDGDDAQRVRVDADGAGVLVVADAVQEGWRAYLDGERVDLLTVDGAVRGVAVPAGEHEVELRYEPAGRPVLAPVAAAAAVLWLAAAVALTVRGRRAAGARGGRHRAGNDPLT